MWTDAARERYNDDGRRYPSDLTDAEWDTIAPVLSTYTTLTADLREMVNACLYLEKAGCPWRFLPKEFGPWQSVRTWHDRFRTDGVWSDVAALLVRATSNCRLAAASSRDIAASRWRKVRSSPDNAVACCSSRVASASSARARASASSAAIVSAAVRSA